MKKFLEAILWILTDILIIFAIVFLPSFFSLFCFLTAIMIVPVEEWQLLIRKAFKKSVRNIILALFVAFTLALFPLTAVIGGLSNTINSVINPPASSEEDIVYYEEPESFSSSSKFTTSSSDTTTSKTNTTTSTNSKHEINNNTSNINRVYRTPSGKKYHLDAECGGKNSYEVSINEATREGLTPCKKCAE